jgi:flagellar hook-associated protein 3 FlgL
LNSDALRANSGYKYQKASEAPAEAAKAGKLNRQYESNEGYMTTMRDTISTFTSVESAVLSMSNMADSAYNNILLAMNGTMAQDDRNVYAEELRNIQEQLVMVANTTVGDKYLFGGASTKELPFKLEGGVLTYRGVNVDSDQAEDQAMLTKLNNEKVYVDLGFGLSIESSGGQNTVNPGSAFNIAHPGISILGYGVDSVTGNSNNIINTIGKLAEELSKPTLDRDTLQVLAEDLNSQRRNILVNLTQVGTNSKFLDQTQTRMENTQDILYESIYDIMFEDPAKAITDWQYQQFVYNAALKMGSSMLSNSFIDYMN